MEMVKSGISLSQFTSDSSVSYMSTFVVLRLLGILRVQPNFREVLAYINGPPPFLLNFLQPSDEGPAKPHKQRQTLADLTESDGAGVPQAI
jgi:hypothetical protein